MNSRWLAATACLAGALAMGVGACGGDDDDGGGGGDQGGAKPPAGGSAEQQVRQVFEDYTAALGSDDYGTACKYLAPETIAKLEQNVEKLTGSASDDCEGNMRKLYGRVTGDAAKRLDAVTRTARIDRITVTGDSAIVNWSAEYAGKRVPVSQSARRIGGDWKLVDVSN